MKARLPLHWFIRVIIYVQYIMYVGVYDIENNEN